MCKDGRSRMRIIQLFRKKNPSFYSIENVFDRVREAADESVSIETLSVPRYGLNVANCRFLFQSARSAPNAVFHITGDIHYAMLMLPAGRTVLTVHDCVFVRQRSGLRGWLIKLLFLDLPVRRARYITTISAKTKNEIIHLTNCDPEKIRVISNPLSGKIQFQDKPFNKECPVLLFIGVTPNKNLKRVVDALSGLSCLLKIIGKPDNETSVLLATSGVSYTIRHNLTEQELAEAYAASDLVLFPSLYEGFGLPVIEGFQAGRAVLTSDLSPMRDIAAGAACLIDPLDAGSIRTGLEKLILDDEYREHCIRKGIEVARGYSAAGVYSQYLELYKEVYQKSCVG